MEEVIQEKKTRTPNKTVEEKKSELIKAIHYHEECIAKLNAKVEALDKPRARRMSKRQQLLKGKIDSGVLTLEEAKVLGYKE